MTIDEETAWRRRMEWKLDRLAHHVTCLLLTQTAGPPPLPPRPAARPGPRWRGMIRRVLADALRAAGEKLFTVVVPYILPALGTLAVLGRHGLGKLWDALLAAF
jgi:hypothetical protein